MAKFNLENYETVEDRLKAFWKDYPDGRIETDIIHITQDGTCVTVRAEIYRLETDARPVTTGIAQETKGQGGFANADAWMENCETSAIGRALANWKYQGSNKPRPSKEEMSKSAPKVEVEKKPVAKPSEAELESMNKVIDEMVATPKANTHANAEQINHVIYKMVDDKSVADSIKAEVYQEVIEKGFSTEVEDWTNDEVGKFLDLFEKKSEQVEQKDLVSEVFGVVEDKSSELKLCPQCNKAENIEDNRDKKASDPKFSKIPDFACSSYGQNNGCGWGGYIGGYGDKEVPSTWL
jgi:hypothetical protein